MHRLSIVVLTLALSGGCAAAASSEPDPGDPLQSAECLQALDALQTQEAAAAPTPMASAPFRGSRLRAPDSGLEAARRRTAAACLRNRADPPPARQPYVQAPLVVPPLAAAPPRLPLPRAHEPPPPIATPARRPRFITTCDAVGCWADDGSRLHRVGPNLRGPRGACTVQGTLLQCP